MATVIIKYHSQTTSYFKTEYLIKGVRNSTIEQGGREELFEGAKNVVVYDSIHTGVHELQICQPLFMANEYTRKTTGVVTRNESGKTFSEIYFEFTIVDDRKYTKCQCVKGQTDNIKTGDTFEVEYIADNPERAILLLDSLKKEKINGTTVRVPFENTPKQNILQTIATCTHCGLKYDHDDFTFVYKGVTYSSFNNLSYKGCGKGDKFIVKIDTLHPMFRNTVLMSRPVFTFDEKTKKCNGTITNVTSGGALIEFKYEAETGHTQKKKEFIREQTVTPPNAAIKKGQTYEVEYYIDSPQRAILLLDRQP